LITEADCKRAVQVLEERESKENIIKQQIVKQREKEVRATSNKMIDRKERVHQLVIKKGKINRFVVYDVLGFSYSISERIHRSIINTDPRITYDKKSKDYIDTLTLDKVIIQQEKLI